MSRKPKLYVVVPVLDEADNVDRLLQSFRDMVRSLPELDAHFIMVDDGSSDGTAAKARSQSAGLSFEVLCHPVNLGPGAAFATAFASLAGRLHEDDYVLTLEGDNTSRLELVRQMVTRAAEGFDVVLASPYLYGGGITNTPAVRVVLSRVANMFLKEALGIHGIMTMSSFFRLCRGHAVLSLQRSFGPGIVERRGFESMVEMLLKMIYLGFTVSEVAMLLDTTNRIGPSKMRVVHTAMGYLTLWRDQRRWRRQALPPQPATSAPGRITKIEDVA